MQQAGKPVNYKQVVRGGAEAARQAHNLEVAGPNPAPASEFHAHLDTCAVCRSQPFNLCAVGTRLLGAALVAAEPKDEAKKK